jgi:hypothetical protein
MKQLERLLSSLERAEAKVDGVKSQLVDALINEGHWHCLSPNITAIRRLLKDAAAGEQE